MNSVAISPDGRYALSASMDKTIKLWDLVTGQCVRTIKEQQSEVLSVAFSPDGHEILSGCYNATIQLWDLTTDSACKLT